MSTLNRMPSYTEALETGSVTTRGWYTFWLGLLQGQPVGAPSAIVPGVSPFSYVAPLGGSVILSGGTVSKVEVSRDGMTFYVTGQTSGMFPVSQGDTLRVTYSGVPTITFIPR
jgi:hypothetical protein